MNLVTAVLVEHALEHASQEAELARIRTKEQIKATLPELLDIFSALDKDDSGYITREEVANVSLHVLPKTVLEKVTVDSMEDMFELLDVDGGGSLSLAEFLDGLLLVLLMDMPSWAVQLQKLVIPIRRQTIQISNELELLKPGQGAARQQHVEWQQSVTALLSRVGQISTPLTEKAPVPSVVPSKATDEPREPVVLALPPAECVQTPAELQRLRSSESEATVLDPNDTSEAARVSQMRQTLRQTVGADGRLPKLLEEERRETLKTVVDSTAFEYVTAVLILMNIALIGVEAEMDLLGMDTWWAADVERIFLGIYTVELLIRLTAGGREAFQNSWFWLDVFLVCVGLVALVVVPLVESEASSQEGWMQLLIVRGLRLLRLARILRTVKRFKVGGPL
eukprot:g28560.t1